MNSMSDDSQAENAAQKSTFNIKLKISNEGFELFTEGSIKDIYKEIEAISELLESLNDNISINQEASGVIPGFVEEAAQQAAVDFGDFPTITPGGGIQDNVEKLFSTTWGKTPRGVVEVLKALEVNAVYTEYAQVSNALRRLVSQGKMRRRQKEGKWEYYIVPGKV